MVTDSTGKSTRRDPRPTVFPEDDEYMVTDSTGKSTRRDPTVFPGSTSKGEYDAIASTWAPGGEYDVGGSDHDDDENGDQFVLLDNAIGRNVGSQQSKRGVWTGGSTRDTALRRTQALLSKPTELLSPREKKALDDMLNPGSKGNARQTQTAAEEALGTAEFDDLEFLLTAAAGAEEPLTPSRKSSTRKSVRRHKPRPPSGLQYETSGGGGGGGADGNDEAPAEFFGTRFKQDRKSSGLELPEQFFGKRQGMTFDFINEEDEGEGEDLWPSERVAVAHTSAPVMSAKRASAVPVAWTSPSAVAAAAAAYPAAGPAIVVNDADNSSTLFGSKGLTLLRKPSIRRSGKGAPSYLKKFRPFSVVDVESQHGLVDDDDTNDASHEPTANGVAPRDGDGLRISASVNDTLSSAMFRPTTGRVFGKAKSGRRFGAQIKRLFSGRKKEGSYTLGT